MTLTDSATKSLANSWFQRHPLDHPDKQKAGHTITRDRTCECGRCFVQMILSERQLAAAERMGIVPLIAKQIPGFWVPVHCPSCERKDLGRQARLDEAHARDVHDSLSRRSA